jgi:hypothetical protein
MTTSHSTPSAEHGTITAPITIAEVEVGAEIVRVELKLYNGRPLFSAWRFYRDKAGDLRPGRHGLACSVERLPEVAAAFTAAVARARAEGLLPQEGGA